MHMSPGNETTVQAMKFEPNTASYLATASSKRRFAGLRGCGSERAGLLTARRLRVHRSPGRHFSVTPECAGKIVGNHTPQRGGGQGRIVQGRVPESFQDSA